MITAYEESIPIVTVVFNNSALGWVKHGQQENMDRVIASEFGNLDYAEIATAMGCRGFRVQEPDDLGSALSEAFEGNEPAVVDVVTSLKTSFKDVTSPLLGR